MMSGIFRGVVGGSAELVARDGKKGAPLKRYQRKV